MHKQVLEDQEKVVTRKDRKINDNHHHTISLYFNGLIINKEIKYKHIFIVVNQKFLMKLKKI